MIIFKNDYFLFATFDILNLNLPQNFMVRKESFKMNIYKDI